VYCEGVVDSICLIVALISRNRSSLGEELG